jgi:uncharacterized protein with PCYCGC motif
MDRTKPARSPRKVGPVRVAALALVALFLVSGPALAACSATHPESGGSAAAMPTMHATQAPPAMTEAVWAARPEYVSSNPATEEAYAYALTHPQIVRWMPCYCGCGAMDHGSNLDCYFKRGTVGTAAVFEEHASFCEICVDITLMTKQLSESGQSLTQIRQAIDQTFGGSGPGTDTPQPAA